MDTYFLTQYNYYSKKKLLTSFYADEHMIITEAPEIADCYVTGGTALRVIPDPTSSNCNLN